MDLQLSKSRSTSTLNPPPSSIVAVVTCEVEPGAGFPLQPQENEDLIVLVQSGYIEFSINSQKVRAREGDVVFLPHGEEYEVCGLDHPESNRCAVIRLPLADEQGLGKASGRACHVQTAMISPLEVFGDKVTICLDAEATGGAYTLVFVQSSQSSGPPLHTHWFEDELSIVAQGEVEFVLEGQSHTARVGDVVWQPRGQTHTFCVRKQCGAQMWILMVPGGFCRFFRECAALPNHETSSIVFDVGARYGLSFVSLHRRGLNFEC